MRGRTSSGSVRGTRAEPRRPSRTCSVHYGCRCGSTRFMESLVRNHPRQNPSKGCSTRYLLSLEVRNPSRRQSSASGDDVAVYLLDTSALVKRHIQEAGTSWVRSLTQI